MLSKERHQTVTGPDNIFVERLWRSLKYECVYLYAWETGSEAKAGVRQWIEFYNYKRPHSALGGV
jgi:putative transposase